MRKRWPDLRFLELWCIVWVVNEERVRLTQWAKTMPPVIPGKRRH
jgi:hypothetical protein